MKKLDDTKYLSAAIELAKQAKKRGNHPFGAILVGPDGKILLEGENTVVTEKDCTGHAELNLMRKASKLYSSEFLWDCTIYASTEPCAMCAGSIYWGNVGRVVFALGADRLYQLIKNPKKNPSLAIPCRDVFVNGIKNMEILGPIAIVGAEQVHEGFWDTP